MDSPSLNRDQIWTAVGNFFAAITDANGTKVLRSFYRHAKHWIDVPIELCPSGQLDPTVEKRIVRRGMPPKIEMTALLRIYMSTGADFDPTVDANQMLNPVIDAIERALQIDDVINEACTLGGLVSHCAIDGKLERFSGTLGNEAVVVIPITIVVSP